MAQVPAPLPKYNEVLIKTYATTVTSGDCRVRSLNVPRGFSLPVRLVFGISKPRNRILGSELAGVVEAVGNRVTRFKAGDQVFAFSDAAMGCYAEYKCMPQDGAIAIKPPGLSFEEAAALSFGGTTVLDFFRRAKLQSGESVLVVGASGAVGSAAIQLARHFGAVVSGVCSTTNLKLVRSLGAHEVIDYTREDFTRNGKLYDVIVDTAGTAPFARSQSSLKSNGRLLLVIAGLPAMLQIPWISLTSNKRVIAGPVKVIPEDLMLLARLAASGEFKPVIDRRYRFDQISEAHRYVDTGRKKGNVVISLEPAT